MRQRCVGGSTIEVRVALVLGFFLLALVGACAPDASGIADPGEEPQTADGGSGGSPGTSLDARDGRSVDQLSQPLADAMEGGAGGTDGPIASVDVPITPPTDTAPDLEPDVPMICAPTATACPCQSEGDCRNPAEPRCGAAGRCVACLSTTDNCAAGTYCGPDQVCVAGCKGDTECPGGTHCNVGSHTCVQCLTSDHCPAQMLCSSTGTCLPGCDPAMGKNCPNGLSCCDQRCVDLKTDKQNCGTCGLSCNGAGATCCSGSCANLTSDVKNCGACGHACSTTNANASCTSGMCAWACQGAHAHCGPDNSGCETATNTVSDCGGCGVSCGQKNASAAACGANGMKCSFTCNNGFADCNAANAPDTDGCETSLGTTNNCGTCGRVCKADGASNASAASCSNSTRCAYTCKAKFGDCNANAGGNTDGCETPLGTVSDCGTCGRACLADASSHATATTCNNATRCAFTCKPGFDDCNETVGGNTDGCESSLASINSCGACGRVCKLTNATAATCDGTNCAYTCKAGFDDCNNGGMPGNTNGCETRLNTTENCAACGQSCKLDGAMAATCNGTKCGYTCAPGKGDCNVNTAPNTDGCETTLDTVANCGSCGRTCTPDHTSGASCNGTKCLYAGTCDAEWANCNANTGPDTDGCESSLHSITSCGGCGQVCNPMHAMGNATCDGTKCGYTCEVGFVDCDAAAPGGNTNGCETVGLVCPPPPGP
jgi:hypothetical protein